MARAYHGPYARPSSYHVPYATARVWGTGINEIHSYYGEGPPLRVIGRADSIGGSPVDNSDGPRGRDYQPPMEGSALDPPQENLWGYPQGEAEWQMYGPDSFGQGANAPVSIGDTSFEIIQYMDDRPSWDTPVENERLRRDASTMSPWGTPGLSLMAAVRAGSHRFRANPRQRLVGQGDGYQPISAEPSNSNPTETVSEGWLNKVTSYVADAGPSADEQIFIQTSMRQRYLMKDNMRAQVRGTDDSRTPIASRVEAMVEKVYSTGERLYDMDPYQADEIIRPFRYRTAGIGPDEWMEANEINSLTAFQRVPPPDPSMGIPEVPTPEDYGYTGEDTMYYGL